MSRIDVTELMHDPDFVGPITHIFRTSRLNQFGENVLTECAKETQGSVQPISGKEIQKIPESLRVADMMTFYFEGEIIAAPQGKYPDILVFNGKRYQVMTVNDWSAWGAGWVEGMCVAERIAG